MKSISLLEATGDWDGRKFYYIYEGEPSMENWIGLVEFYDKTFKVMPFRKEQKLSEQIEISRVCSEKISELWP